MTLKMTYLKITVMAATMEATLNQPSVIIENIRNPGRT